MSDAFKRFRFSFFEDPNSAHDGLDTEALAELKAEERSQAEDMLIRYLPDTRGVIGLGVLRSRRAELQLLRLFNAERQDDPTSGAVVELAKALWQIRPDPRWLAAATRVLAAAEYDMQRMNAAIALSVFRDIEAVGPLVTALDDPSDLVRHHAARALLLIHGLSGQANVTTNSEKHMMYRVMSDDAAERESGKRDILAAIAGRPISAPSARPAN